jgi:hypothetical protein
VGTTGARRCALPLCSAHLCAGFICGNIDMTWWRGCGCIPGGQGVAGSNPAVPTKRSRSEGVPGSRSGPFRSSGANRGHLTPVTPVNARCAMCDGAAVAGSVYQMMAGPTVLSGRWPRPQAHAVASGLTAASGRCTGKDLSGFGLCHPRVQSPSVPPPPDQVRPLQSRKAAGHGPFSSA